KGDKGDKGEIFVSSPSSPSPPFPKIGILFYRAHYLAGNTAPIDALCRALRERNLIPVPIFVSSLQDADIQSTLIDYFQPQEGRGIELLLVTTSFSVAKLDSDVPELGLWAKLDVPVFQVILSGGTFPQWEGEFQGLTPRDTAMNVVLPEVDGRIITRAVSFKSVQTRHPLLETDVVVYEPVCDRVEFVADLALNWVKLRQTPPPSRKIALILANYPNRDGRLANGVGLDTPASCVEILNALQEAGYYLENIPETGDELIQLLTSGVTNDSEGNSWRLARQELSGAEYQEYFSTLPPEVQKGICDRWSQKEWGVESEECGKETSLTYFPDSPFPIPGIQLGNIFIGIQPSRGYDIDPSLNYHAPDLEPTTAYLAFYYWLRRKFGAQAIVHIGKHGNLEWLPGKSLALSENCYPEVALGAMPHFYPFIVNDPGEGSQAKRRAHAVIIDHLTPPMTRAELYGGLQQLEGLVDEYYEAQSLDPSRLPLLRDRIFQLMTEENLAGDGVTNVRDGVTDLRDVTDVVNRIDGYLCELKEAQIRDGLHIFGKCPQGRQLRDLIVAIARHPGRNRLGLTRAIAKDWGWDFDPLIPNRSNNEIENNFITSGGSHSSQNPDDTLTPPLAGGSWEDKNSSQNLDDTLAPPLAKGGWGGNNSSNKQASPPKLDIPLTSGESQKNENTSSESILPPYLPNGQPYLPSGQDAHTTTNLPSSNNPLTAHLSLPAPEAIKNQNIRSAIEKLEAAAAKLVEELIASHNQQPITNNQQPITNNQQIELNWIRDRILPALQLTNQEITQLLRGLDGHYVPSGAAGAPTRGRPEVLPTGRNFYSVDIRAIPTETAWDVGRKAAEALIERYTQENGEYPKTLGMSVWGTSTMRTGGDDIAEALALLGVRPVWEGISRRVIDFEILPLSVLGRPRVDVTLRISGFFRDGFPNLIDLFYNAVVAVSSLDEPIEENPLAAQVKKETELWQEAGLSQEEAKVRSRWRIFGSKPGAYGAGLQGLIEGQNWQDEEDLARAYLNWSSFAYGEIPPCPPLIRGESLTESLPKEESLPESLAKEES
ncbi:MAG TPA: cobaltochelatase subunit CobN, partial [Cyanobacteria bacterium UBA11159]|nr:cobaltochelatase subunit CobN [Cyanobacteria bacterium UBA11159]HBS67982.1 cobaltochelatase subunit CobN [Cyanobacteria bacterium UBA11153]